MWINICPIRADNSKRNHSSLSTLWFMLIQALFSLFKEQDNTLGSASAQIMFHRSTMGHPKQWHGQTLGHTQTRAISKTKESAPNIDSCSTTKVSLSSSKAKDGNVMSKTTAAHVNKAVLGLCSVKSPLELGRELWRPKGAETKMRALHLLPQADPEITIPDAPIFCQ